MKCYFLHLSVGQEGLCAIKPLQKLAVSCAGESHAAFKKEENLDGSERLMFSVEQEVEVTAECTETCFAFYCQCLWQLSLKHLPASVVISVAFVPIYSSQLVLCVLW